MLFILVFIVRGTWIFRGDKMNPTGWIGRMSAEIMIAIACVSFSFMWYICMTHKGRKMMDRFDNWIGKILNRGNK